MTIFNENIFRGTLNSAARGEIQNYYCKFTRKVGFNCEAGMRTVFCNDSDEVIVEISSSQHDHTEGSQAIKLTDEVKNFIRSRMDNMTAKPIYNNLSVKYLLKLKHYYLLKH